MKKIICDASSLISLSENCMLCMLEKLSGKVQLIVPHTVYKEVVENPINSRKYGFKAFQMDGYFISNLLHEYKEDLQTETNEILNLANNVFEFKNRAIKLIQAGEAEAIACLNQMNEKTFLVDERTMRLLIEDPLKLQSYMEHTMKKKIIVDHNALAKFQEKTAGIKIIRSAELAVYAYEKHWFDHRATEKTLKDMLFALKFAGCSITDAEINRYVEMLG